MATIYPYGYGGGKSSGVLESMWCEAQHYLSVQGIHAELHQDVRSYEYVINCKAKSGWRHRVVIDHMEVIESRGGMMRIAEDIYQQMAQGALNQAAAGQARGQGSLGSALGGLATQGLMTATKVRDAQHAWNNDLRDRLQYAPDLWVKEMEKPLKKSVVTPKFTPKTVLEGLQHDTHQFIKGHAL